MIWRQISTTGSTNQAPESVFVVDMNARADTDAMGLAEIQHALH
jgi:hypothetical protein